MLTIAATAALVLSQDAWPLAQGDIAPACTATIPDTGKSISVADYKGKIVYLDFWASWCVPCRQSFPFMNDMQRELGDKGLQIIAIGVDKVPDDAKRFLERYPAHFTIALDPAGACPRAYQLKGMPSSFIIDAAGSVRAVHIGFRDGDKAEIRGQLLDALNRAR